MRVASSHLLSSSSLSSGSPPAGAVSSSTMSTRFSPESEERRLELKLECRELVPLVTLEALLPLVLLAEAGSAEPNWNSGISKG